MRACRWSCAARWSSRTGRPSAGASPASSCARRSRWTTSAACPSARPAIADLYEIDFDEIVRFLHELGSALDPDTNPHVKAAKEAARVTSGLTEPLLDQNYRSLPYWFDRVFVREMVEQTDRRRPPGGLGEQRSSTAASSASGPSAPGRVHVVAGNSPVLSGVTVIRNAVTRSDAIIKAPSNDPLTAVAIARTMIDIDPDHPLTKHLSVAYWKGGDIGVEEQLYRPEHIEKIVAWGGLAAVNHVTQYIQPGLELIALDPKRWASIVGPEAFADEDTMREVARASPATSACSTRRAAPAPGWSTCSSGTDPGGWPAQPARRDGLRRADSRCPSRISTKPLRFDPELRVVPRSQRLDDDWYRVIGGEHGEGAVVVSQLDEPVDYSPLLSGRTANLVPVDDLEKVTAAVNAYTQTVGISRSR